MQIVSSQSSVGPPSWPRHLSHQVWGVGDQVAGEPLVVLVVVLVLVLVVLVGGLDQVAGEPPPSLSDPIKDNMWIFIATFRHNITSANNTKN